VSSAVNAAVSGAAGGAVSGGLATGTLMGTLDGAGLGALSSELFDAVGYLPGGGNATFGGDDSWKYLLSAGAHGVVGGIVSVAGGGSFQSGFIAGGIGGLMDPYAGMVNQPGSGASGLFAATAISAVSGGLGSQLGGEKFANGAETGAFGYLFNDCLHNTNCLNPEQSPAQTGIPMTQVTLADGTSMWCAEGASADCATAAATNSSIGSPLPSRSSIAAFFGSMAEQSGLASGLSELTVVGAPTVVPLGAVSAVSAALSAIIAPPTIRQAGFDASVDVATSSIPGVAGPVADVVIKRTVDPNLNH